MRASFLSASLLALLISFTSVQAEDIFRIKISKDYNKYSNEELRERVWQLERAVEQLQTRIFHLEAKPNQAPQKEWTCRIQVFGKTHIASGSTKGSAIAKVLEKCSNASHSIHCNDSDAKCESE